MSRAARSARLLLAGLAVGACARATTTGGARAAAVDPALRTRPERTAFAETSRYDDVMAFLRALDARAGGRVHLTSMGRTSEGREIPVVIASRPLVTTPEAARASGRPIVYVQGNIHAGEIEGKEALQQLLRELVLDPRPNVLDSLVLIAVPIYNADGNEKVGPQARQRSEQNGPELVGQRPNAAGLDLNRDYVKAEAPETRAALALLNAWDPDVFVDLHTTDGSYHGYALTWSPSLHPGAPLRAFNQDTLLPELQRRLTARRSVATFPYGNFALEYGADVNADTTKQGWYTYDHRPRFGTNYYGLRGRLSVLLETYSHDPFERRVRSMHASVAELLSLLAESGVDVQARAARFRAVGDTVGVLRARLTERPVVRDVVAEDLARTTDTVRTEAGVPRGLRRTGRFRTVRIPLYDRFTATLVQRVPAGGWALAADAPGAEAAVRLLRTHGVVVERLDEGAPVDASVFRADSVVMAARPFQGHREVRLEGAWRTERRRLDAGAYVIPASQRFALVALQLLEPQSDDGLTTWNVFDAGLRAGGDHPVVRLAAPVPGRRRAIE